MVDKAWHLDAIGARRAWRITQGSPEVTIAFVDSGIDYNHADLAANVLRKASELPFDGKDSDGNGFVDDAIGWDFVRSGPLPFDRSGHGTFLAGIAAALEDNGVGAAGICPRCSVMSSRFLNWEGLGDTEDGILAIDYAIRAGASVINLSFSGEGYDEDLHQVLKLARDRDIVVIAAASNDGEDLDREDVYPARYRLPNLITVAASERDGSLWEDSNWGRKMVHLAAPGSDILGPWEKGWDIGSGTSNAAAVASGAAGLLRSAAPHLSAEQVVQIMTATVRKKDVLLKKVKSGGVLDLEAAMACAVSPNLPCLR